MAKVICKNCGKTFYHDIMNIPNMRIGNDPVINCPACNSEWIEYIEPGQPIEP